MKHVAPFKVGEVLDLRGGSFRVAAVGRRFVRLECLPGTHARGGMDAAEIEKKVAESIVRQRQIADKLKIGAQAADRERT